VEVAGVGEEQRRVVAVHHQAGDGLRTGIVVNVVHAREAGDEAQDRIMRPRHPDQQVRHRQPDRDQHAVQDVQAQHGQAGGKGDGQFGAAERKQPPEGRDVDQPEGRTTPRPHRIGTRAP
jgi:hypothetical protein